MEQTIRRLVALAPALALIASLAAARPTQRHDRVNEICVIGGEIDYCVPNDSEPG
jgi:hypothetical protein